MGPFPQPSCARSGRLGSTCGTSCRPTRLPTGPSKPCQVCCWPHFTCARLGRAPLRHPRPAGSLQGHQIVCKMGTLCQACNFLGQVSLLTRDVVMTLSFLAGDSNHAWERIKAHSKACSSRASLCLDSTSVRDTEWESSSRSLPRLCMSAYWQKRQESVGAVSQLAAGSEPGPSSAAYVTREQAQRSLHQPQSHAAEQAALRVTLLHEPYCNPAQVGFHLLGSQSLLL